MPSPADRIPRAWTYAGAPTVAHNRSTGLYRGGDIWVDTSGGPDVYILVDPAAGTWERMAAGGEVSALEDLVWSVQ